MKRLDFIVIGAGKAGTTWLWQLLREHPGCYLPDEKELHYFNVEPLEPIGRDNPNYRKSLDWYHDHFREAPAGRRWGEISPSYLWSGTAPQRIREYNPDVKIVAILRDPLERAFSHYLYRVQKGLIAETGFTKAIERDSFMLERGLYGRCLQNYYGLFSKDQIKILFFDDLKHQPETVVQEVEAFLGLEEFFPAWLGKRVNVSGKPRWPVLIRMLGIIDLASRRLSIKEGVRNVAAKTGILNLARKIRKSSIPYEGMPKIETETERRLREYFSPDITIVERLTGRNLAKWKGE